MSQHHQQQHHQQPQYVHYTGPPGTQLQPQVMNGNVGVSPQDTTHQPQSQGIGMAGGVPLVATGDWTKDLVHLAKTAELKCVSFLVGFLLWSQTLWTCLLYRRHSGNRNSPLSGFIFPSRNNES
jgi:hypothetical protein